MHPDPLVATWHDTTRPLNWRTWSAFSPQIQARLRYYVMRDLQTVAQCPWAPWWWRHTHRELLELKACCGHETPEQEAIWID